jgi:guanine deaminase
MTCATDDHKSFLQEAINLAKESVEQGGFPAGAVVVKDGIIIGRGISIGNKLNDPTSHGEMSSIRDACRNLKSSDLSGSTLYSSMQPCLMCFAASMWGGISKIFFAASKDRVSPEYYGGHYQVAELNPNLLKPIELTHIAELEEQSLTIVRSWENSLG